MFKKTIAIILCIAAILCCCIVPATAVQAKREYKMPRNYTEGQAAYMEYPHDILYTKGDLAVFITQFENPILGIIVGPIVYSISLIITTLTINNSEKHIDEMTYTEFSEEYHTWDNMPPASNDFLTIIRY